LLGIAPRFGQLMSNPCVRWPARARGCVVRQCGLLLRGWPDRLHAVSLPV